jgi:hypothetical protein
VVPTRENVPKDLILVVELRIRIAGLNLFLNGEGELIVKQIWLRLGGLSITPSSITFTE